MISYRMLCRSFPAAVTVQKDQALRCGLTCRLSACTSATEAPLGDPYSP